MKKLELVFGEQKFTAKFGIGFIGRYLKEKNQTIELMFEDFQKNPFLTAPSLMYGAIKEGTPDFNISESDFEDLIDEFGGVSSPQLVEFIQAFTNSLIVDNPQTVGKPKPKAKKS